MDSADNTRPQPSGNPFREAYFHNSASSPSDALLVVIPDFSLDQPFGDPDGVVWSPMGGALPQAGDRALVAESTDGTWWVVSWWSDQQDTSASHGDVTTLDARLDALEAKRTVSGTVASDGSESSPEFSVIKNGTGDYTVTFTIAFSATPDVIPGVGPSSTFHYVKLHASTPPSTTGFRIICLAVDGGAALDGAFTFIARGTA